MSNRYDVVRFEKDINFRIKKSDLAMIKKIVSKDDETYSDVSHYCRCAVIRLIREDKKRLRL